MSPVVLVLTIIQFICAIFLIVTVLLQSGKKAGLSGSISGMADTFLSKNKARTWDAKLAKLTAFIALLFVALTFVISLIA